MFHLLLFAPILLINLVNGNINLTCYECNSCTSTPAKISTGNRLCFRIQVNCLAADIHIIDLTGDQLHSNHTLLNCGQTLIYSSACTIAYHCCHKNKCNTYENPLLLSSSSTTLFIFKKIVISFHLLLLYHKNKIQ